MAEMAAYVSYNSDHVENNNWDSISDFEDFHDHDDDDDDDDNYFDDFEYLDNHNNNFQKSAAFSKDPTIEEITTTLSSLDLTRNTMALTFPKFEKLPEEIQMSIWKFTALQVRRTIVMEFERASFRFANCPSTPAFMHVCYRARKYGLEIFKAVNQRGVAHDITNRRTFNSLYFYVNPISDDFILRFGEEKDCPQPVYCPIESSSSYMRHDLRAAEIELEEEHRALALMRQGPPRNALAVAWGAHVNLFGPNFLVPAAAPQAGLNANAAPFQPGFAPNVVQPQPVLNPNAAPFQPGFAQNIAQPQPHVNFNPAQGAAPLPPQPPPPPVAGEPVFPADEKLPEFFTNIRSVGINLELPFSWGFNFSYMSQDALRRWAKDAVEQKFDIVFTKILDKFPNLEYTFAVVRAHGRSNQESCPRGFERELDKKKWTDVGMAKGEGIIMGCDEFRHLENQAKLWFMMERIDRGMNLNQIDFELYVQRNIHWEI